MQKSHLAVGILGVLVFLGTGLYMENGFPELYAGNETVRYLYRANHIYLLLASLLNLALGCRLTVFAQSWPRRLGALASMFLLIAPALLGLAFFLDPPRASPQRLVTAFGIYAAFGGVLLYAALHGWEGSGQKRSRSV